MIFVFKKIEKLYKTKSPYNIIRRKIIYFGSPILLAVIIINFTHAYWISILLAFLFNFIIVLICCIDLGAYKEKNKNKKISEIIIEDEKTMFVNFLKENQIYNKETLNCIIQHYSMRMQRKVFGNNCLAVLAIVISILVPFITNGFDKGVFLNAIPIVVLCIVVTVVLYTMVRDIREIRLILKGEDFMNENLEYIFSEIYMDFNCKKTKLKSTKML